MGVNSNLPWYAKPGLPTRNNSCRAKLELTSQYNNSHVLYLELTYPFKQVTVSFQQPSRIRCRDDWFLLVSSSLNPLGRTGADENSWNLSKIRVTNQERRNLHRIQCCLFQTYTELTQKISEIRRDRVRLKMAEKTYEMWNLHLQR